MNWLNLQVGVVRAPEYVGSEPVQRATWFNVLAYSAEQENGGRIAGARTWKCRQWQQTCGVTLAEVEAALPLLSWDGGDLVVWSYPADKEAEVRAKRDAGRKGGIKSGESRRNEAEPGQERSTASSTPSSSASTEGKGKEGEEKGNGTPKPPEPSLSLSLEVVDSVPLPKRGPNHTPEAKAIAAIFGRRETTAWSRGELKQLQQLTKDGALHLDDIELLARYYHAERKKVDPKTGLPCGYHRRDLSTFLNNFQGELDRARQWARLNPGAAAKPLKGDKASAPELPLMEPEGFRDWLKATYPKSDHEQPYALIPEFVRNEYRP